MAAAISRAMLAINATLIYHASTYDVDGSRMSQDKTNRRNWRWQAVSCRSAGRHLFSPPRYPALGANKTCLINKCINIPAAHSRSPSFLPFLFLFGRKRCPLFPFPFFTISLFDFLEPSHIFILYINRVRVCTDRFYQRFYLLSLLSKLSKETAITKSYHSDNSNCRPISRATR